MATDQSDLFLQFDPDGTGVAFLHPGTFEVNITYAVVGDLWTQMTDDSQLGNDRHVPATYYWDYDGEILSFELWGEELNPHTRGDTMDREYRLVPDARAAVVATREIPAGTTVDWRNVSKEVIPAWAGSEAFAGMREVTSRVAVAPIAEGQPITPDLLEPAE